MQAFESKTLQLRDFYFTGDDYRYRFESEAKQRFIDVIRERFNAGVAYNGQVLKWDTVIEQKTNELGQFLIGRSSALDFAEPAPTLQRQDSQALRSKIRALTSLQAKELGIGKSTFHYLRKNARNEKTFKVYKLVDQKLARLTP